MKAEHITIHNFRTLADAQIALSPYTLLVGPNNSGKSNVVEAIRVFYEKDTKYDRDTDFPKFRTADQDSWIEVQYRPSHKELSVLKGEYVLPDGTFRVRKYLQTAEPGSGGKPKGGVYAYVDGGLSESRFYNEKCVQNGMLGDVIYVPAVSKLDDHTKLSGPSALRDLINNVLEKIVGGSDSYQKLKDAFGEFSGTLKSEETENGESLVKLEAAISTELAEWDASFALTVSPIAPADVVKSLVCHSIVDARLSTPVDPRVCGQGFQRHLIYTLIRLAARFRAAAPAKGPDFSPTLTWILFEEPEAFLHPDQIAALDANLRSLSDTEGSQVLVTSHSPHFVSRNSENLSAIARLSRPRTESEVGQISKAALAEVLDANQACLPSWRAAGILVDDVDMQIEMESIKHALWLNPLRCSAVFANTVLLVEGCTEIALIGKLVDTDTLMCPSGGLFVLDALGKYNMHRFMNLLGALRIPHAVLYDHDYGGARNEAIAKTIEESRNEFTIGVDRFEKHIEDFLEVPTIHESWRKPQHVMWQLSNGNISKANLDALVAKIEALLGLRGKK